MDRTSTREGLELLSSALMAPYSDSLFTTSLDARGSSPKVPALVRLAPDGTGSTAADAGNTAMRLKVQSRHTGYCSMELIFALSPAVGSFSLEQAVLVAGTRTKAGR